MAESKSLTRFMNNARIQLPGALDQVVMYEFFNVMDEFCQGSRIWQEEINVRLRTGRTNYDVVPGEPGQIIEAISLVNDDGLPIIFTMAEPGHIVLAAELDTNQLSSVITVVLTVVDPTKNDYPQFPDWFLQKYGVAILDGLLGRMMSQAAKPYSNERMAIYHMRRFRAGVAKARVDAKYKNLEGAQAWRFPKFT